MSVAADEVYGYVDRFEYRPGERVEVRLHASDPAVDLELVRLRGADERVPSLQPAEVAVAGVEPVGARVRTQSVTRGSYMRVDGLVELAGAARVWLELWVFPTLLGGGREPILASTLGDDGATGFSICLRAGRPQLWLAAPGGGGAELVCELDWSLPERVWTRLVAELAPGDGEYALRAEPRRLRARRTRVRREPSPIPLAGPRGTLVLAAGLDGQRHYSGKIGAPRLRVAGPGGSPRMLATWELDRDLHLQTVSEATGGPVGVLHGGPTRAVTGPSWRGAEIDPRLAPGEYDAIHFHEDDLDDAGWAPSAAVELPPDLESGIYAVRASSGSAVDRIPFVVLPAGGERPPVAFLAPTFTYLAYGNAMLGDRIDYVGFGISGRPISASERDRQLAGHAEFAGSLYDTHADGSGRCYSSLRRPLFSFRPEWQSAIQQAPRHLGADLYLTGWLERLGQPFDVLTDGALDAGPAALEPYRVLITGSHPEYVSAPELAAIEEFVAAGGRLMYLGGNGFYWVTSVDRERPHVIEVRRGNSATRTWDSPPGETHHSTTGEPGGLWRYRGSAPNRLLGIGMASQGWDEKAPGYERTDAGRAAELAWIFDGVESDRFGEKGLVMGGAAGDEIDRRDPLLGSPPNSVVVASSTGHSRFYKLVHEDQLMSTDHTGGDEEGDVRSDVTITPWPGGGAVFAVGAIAWAGAMAYDDYENDVTRLTTNVLRRFLHPAPLDPGPEDE